MRPGDSKSEPKGGKSEAKVSQREPKVSQREPKVSQREPKRSQREPKGSPKGAKGRPKCIQKSTFGQGREKVAKMTSPRDSPRPFWEPFSIKNPWTNRCENRCRKSNEKWWNFDAKRVQNLMRNLMFFEHRFREKSSFPKRVYPRKPLYSCSRIGVREGSPKKKDIKKRGKSE